MEFLGGITASFCFAFSVLLLLMTACTYCLIVIRERKTGGILKALSGFTKKILLQTIILIFHVTSDLLVFMGITLCFVVTMALGASTLLALIMNFLNPSISMLDIAAMYFYTVSIITGTIWMMWFYKDLSKDALFTTEKGLKKWIDVCVIEANLYELPKRKAHLPFDMLFCDEWEDVFESQKEQSLRALADELNLPYEEILLLHQNHSQLEEILEAQKEMSNYALSK